MSIGDLWRGLIKRWLVPVSMAELSEIIGRVPENAKAYRSLAKPASANSSGAGLGTPAQGLGTPAQGLGTPAQGGMLSSGKAVEVVPQIAVYFQPALHREGTVEMKMVDYILEEDSACGLVDADSSFTQVTFIPWDSIVCIEISGRPRFPN